MDFIQERENLKQLIADVEEKLTDYWDIVSETDNEARYHHGKIFIVVASSLVPVAGWISKSVKVKKILQSMRNFTKTQWDEFFEKINKGLGRVEDVVNIKYGKNFISKLSSNTILNTLEKSIAEESYQILNSKEFEKILEGFASKTPVQIEINGRTISYDNAPFSGMTWFEKNGFNIGEEAFAGEDELIKTILHEMHRLKTSKLRGSGTAAEVSEETKAAYDFANKTINLFK